jgi:hypothetical protein
MPHTFTLFYSSIIRVLTVPVNFMMMLPPEGVAPGNIDANELNGLERAGAFGTHGEAYLRWSALPLSYDG